MGVVTASFRSVRLRIFLPVGEQMEHSATLRPRWQFTLGFGFRNSSRTGFLVDECHVYVSPYFWIQVDASDYETTLVRMDSFTGTSYDWNTLPLPQMKVQVSPRRPPPAR